MVEPHVLARAEELSLQINLLHVSYLQADESPQKIEQRSKLENFIRKYLCLIAHGRKFIFRETAEILRCSVDMKNFSAYRASTAWNAIARYAANLVAQPWRKEFRVIKTFSGFYMHDIEENLVGAERLLDCMGYKRIDHSSLVLEQPIDLDAVINVSRDAIVAFVECQIMKEIWEGVYTQFACSWLEVLNFRESHICSPESAIKSLSYLYQQNCFHHQQMLAPGVPHDPYSSTARIHHHSPQSNCLYGQTVSPQINMPYYGYSSYPSCVVPPQPRYACVVNPQQVMGYPTSPSGYHQQAKSPVQHVSAIYHYPHSHQGLPVSAHNGFVVPQPAAALPQSYNCAVPTGQLIELDSNTPVGPSSRPCRMSTSLVEDMHSPEARNGNAVEGADRTSNLYSDEGFSKRESPVQTDSKTLRPTTLDDLKPRRNGMHTDVGEVSFSHLDKYSRQHPKHARKAGAVAPTAPMQDGTGTWESWDYVYRNLESQGYNKDVGERGDILHSATRRGSVGSAGSSPNVNGTVARNSRNTRDTEVLASVDQSSYLSHLSDGIHSMRLNCDNATNGRSVDVVDARNTGRDSKSNSVKDKDGIKVSNITSKTLQRDQKRDLNSPSSSTFKKGQDNKTQEEAVNFWECVFCTYHNKKDTLVCEICGKSHQPGNEDKPLISGGRECPKCTLVNARGVVSCEACQESLKNSPTYI